MSTAEQDQIFYTDSRLNKTTISEAREAVIKLAAELTLPKDMGQREYMEWEIKTKDKLRIAVINLQKLEAEKK